MSKETDTARYFEVNFRTPIYARGTFPILAQELIELVADFLWDEPVQLTRCCLVCPAWYNATARRHLSSSTVMRSTTALGDLVHVLMSRGYGRYGRALHALEIRDDPVKPYAHSMSVRVPGCLLLRLWHLMFVRLDWTLVRPHMSFFTYLTYYASVTYLELSRCRFRRADEIRTMINALSSLKMLHLDPVTIQLAPLASAVQQPEVTMLSICCPRIRRPSISHSRCPKCFHSQNSKRCCMRSLLFARFISQVIPSGNFRALRSATFLVCLLLGPQRRCPAHVTADLLQVTSTFAAKFFGLYARRCRQLQQLHISFLDTPSPVLQQSVQKLLRESGAVWKGLSWERHRDPAVSSLPQHSPDPMPPMVPHNSSLENLFVALSTPSSPIMSWDYRILLTIFSQIGSPCLRSIMVELQLHGFSLPDAKANAHRDMADSISIFHAVLSQDVFMGLADVHIRYICIDDWQAPVPEAALLASAAIRAFIVPLHG